MVSEHHSRKFHESLLSDTFGQATLGNGIVAVAAGLVAGQVADQYGYVAPFVVALVPLFLVGCIVMKTWPENYGDQSASVGHAFGNAWSAVKDDRRILFLGAAQSAFEGAMYTFVFMWTPAMCMDGTKDLPYGLIFSVFMICVMLGSSVFSLIIKTTSIEVVPLYIHSLAILSAGLTWFFIDNQAVVYFSFLLFEVACGIFFPAYGTLRSIYVPEETRATVMNFFRIPLNAFVVILLVKVKYMPVQTVFLICVGAHLFSLCVFFVFYNATVARAKTPLRADHK